LFLLVVNLSTGANLLVAGEKRGRLIRWETSKSEVRGEKRRKKEEEGKIPFPFLPHLSQAFPIPGA